MAAPGAMSAPGAMAASVGTEPQAIQQESTGSPCDGEQDARDCSKGPLIIISRAAAAAGEEEQESYQEAVPTPAAESPTLPRRSLFKASLPKADLFKVDLPRAELSQPEFPKAALFSSSEQSGATSSSEVGMYTAPASPEEGEGEGESRSILAQKAEGRRGGEERVAGAGEVTPPGSGEKQVVGAEGAKAEALDPFMRKVLEAEALGVVALEKKGGRVRNSPLMTKEPSPPKNPWSPVRKAEVGPYDCTKRSLAASLDSFSLPASSGGIGSFSSRGNGGSGSSAAFHSTGHAGMRMSYGQ
ncbi:hypothetical protein CLOP_g9181 [Closterium sp. NIES-67]|nr:hypothetical protein CLOP_g9181 [Closterium sp. NIES-67]